MPGERMNVTLGAGAMVLPGGAAVRRAHEAAELDAGQDDVRVMRAGRDPPDVRCPRARREAPGRGRRELAEGGKLLPGAVASRPEGARLTASVRVIGGAIGDREDVSRR